MCYNILAAPLHYPMNSLSGDLLDVKLSTSRSETIACSKLMQEKELMMPFLIHLRSTQVHAVIGVHIWEMIAWLWFALVRGCRLVGVSAYDKVMCVEITNKMMRHSFLVVILQGNMIKSTLLWNCKKRK